MVGYVERRLLALHRVLYHGRPEHFLVLPAQGKKRLHEQGEGLALVFGKLRINAGGQRRRLAQVLVVDEFVAVIAQQLRR